MKKSDYILKSFLNALGVFIYVSAVALLLSNGKTIFGGEDSFFVPVFMMLLLVVSASITGLLVLGKPIFLYLNGLKKEAMIMLFTTLGWLVLFLLGVVVALMVR